MSQNQSRPERRHLGRIWLIMSIVAALVFPLAAAAQEPPDEITRHLQGNDEVIPDPSGFEGLSLQATDPLGLVPGLDIVRLHSTGTDVIDVWACGVGVNAQQVVAELDAAVAPYFAHHSRGRLQVDFVAGGKGPADSQACMDLARGNASGNANGVLLAVPGGGGVGSPGNGPSFPANGRWAIVGYEGSFPTVATHELGHTQYWPHSFTTNIPKNQGGEYDNTLDVMSGNYGLVEEGGGGFSYGTFDQPYDTAVINRYAAGWIDPSQVVVVGRDGANLTLQTSGGNGKQMAVIPAGDRYFTLGARTTSQYDPIPEIWNGVEVYEVTPCPYAQVFGCFDDERFDMGFRQHIPLGKVSFDPGDIDAYEKPLAHIIRPGTSKTVGDRTVSVKKAANGAYQVTVSEGSFVDVAGSVFVADINWLAASGITRGCNPPVNDLFCPDDPVTRGQMAAFLHRALPGLTLGNATDFADDNGLVFEADIEWLAAAGVTKGCNPPTNNRFCPGDTVTRGQMAAFLHRALPNLPQTGSTDFADDNGLVFEADIEWLAATGVTKGCNPPTNNRFCPGDPVTRGAMAAFLHRALGS